MIRNQMKPPTTIKKKIAGFVGKVLFSSQGFPIILCLTVIGVLLVLFRMKSVELDYDMVKSNKEITKVRLENKELKARKARMLSVKRLRGLAKKHDLSQPKQEQIIVIP